MKYILVSILVVAFVTDPLRIGKINRAKSEAREAYTSGNYKAAIQKYRYLIDSMKVAEDELKLNLANAYFMVNDTANAITQYESLTGSNIKNVVRSKAHQQLGILHYRKQKLEEALNDFKQAIKAHPDNMDARYNYELLKKKLDEKNKKDQQQQQQNKDQKQDQQKKDQQNKDQEKQDQKDQQQKDQEKKEQEKKEQQQKEQQKKDQEQKDKEQQQKEKEQQQKDQQKKDQEKKDQQDKKEEPSEQKEEKDKEKKPNPQLSEKLEQMKISEEKARMILEAMKNQEVQYLQQNKRKATKPKDKGKPDW
ncbi:MAG TPA: tetratricopeptide repeat protein [Ohtaekwangia sp.]|uniref:tetratricopeptide repeat protein n=1 Tax=Ohtaekwangia sp. TaxID=2066019 RepID=UPI002F948C6F